MLITLAQWRATGRELCTWLLILKEIQLQLLRPIILLSYGIRLRLGKLGILAGSPLLISGEISNTSLLITKLKLNWDSLSPLLKICVLVSLFSLRGFYP